MWRSEVDGRHLNFRLKGINNQNFIMEDEETGTWWQQVTGEAIRGPLDEHALEALPYDIVSLEIWRAENPDGRILDVEAEHAGDYFADSDTIPIGVPDELVPKGELEPRDLVVGVELDGRAKAYPLTVLRRQTPISDRIGDVPLLVAVAADGKSVRVFERRLDGNDLELYAIADARPPAFVDAASGTRFDFRGVAIDGPLAGRTLPRIPSLTEFWFDWHNYHRDTAIYRGGSIPAR